MLTLPRYYTSPHETTTKKSSKHGTKLRLSTFVVLRLSTMTAWFSTSQTPTLHLLRQARQFRPLTHGPSPQAPSYTDLAEPHSDMTPRSSPCAEPTPRMYKNHTPTTLPRPPPGPPAPSLAVADPAAPAVNRLAPGVAQELLGGRQRRPLRTRTLSRHCSCHRRGAKRRAGSRSVEH